MRKCRPATWQTASQCALCMRWPLGYGRRRGRPPRLSLGPAALAWTRRALGLGEAFNWPCALRVTANLLPPKDRGLGNGIFASGAAAGAFLAPFIISPIAATFGWRPAFFAIGSLGALVDRAVVAGHPAARRSG